jgi:phosphoribosylformimino-5-aminoimidazole carboxamide ribonucleotide (ProFAR) isomerase
MKFRPCIDLHNGVVKQIVGSTLSDETDRNSSSISITNANLVENFVATKPAAEYAAMYNADQLTGTFKVLACISPLEIFYNKCYFIKNRRPCNHVGSW